MFQDKQSKPLQNRLRLIRTLTVLFALVLRILTPGWILILFAIPLLIIVVIHTLVQNKAIKNIPETKPVYASLILLSNLFFFLGFVLQVDGGDTPEYYVPIFFGRTFPMESVWPDIFSAISAVSFLALIVSWIVLLALKNRWFKREQTAVTARPEESHA